MAAGVKIQHKRKAGSFTTTQLAAGEIGVNTTADRLEFSTDGTDIIAVGIGACLAAELDLTSTEISTVDPDNVVAKITNVPIGTYIVEAYLRGGPAFGDGRLTVNFGYGATVGWGEGVWTCQIVDPDAMAEFPVESGSVTDLTVAMSRSGGEDSSPLYFQFHGSVNITVAGSFILFAGQANSDPGAAQVYRGAWMRLTPTS